MGAVSDAAGKSKAGKLNARRVLSVCDCVQVCVSLKGWMHAKGESNTMSECEQTIHHLH